MTEREDSIDEQAGAAKEQLIAGENRRRNGDYQGALDDFNAVLNQSFESGPMRNLLQLHAYICRGATHSALNEHDVAIDDFSRAIQINPEHAPAYFHRAIAWENKGELDQALDDYARAIRLDPDNAEVRARQTQAKSMHREED